MQSKNKYRKDFEEVKNKGFDKIPSYPDLMKERGMDSVKVYPKPVIITNDEENTNMMQGWKTWLGAFLMLVSIIVTYVLGMPEIGEAIKNLALMLLGIGVAHKIEKASK